MRFPKRIRFRGRVLAVIYAKCKGRDSYRLAWRVAGHRRMASFPTYAAAKAQADRLVRDLASGSQATALTQNQANDALAALERLEAFQKATGRRRSLLGGISEYCEAAGKLHGFTLGEAVDGFLRTVAAVQRKDIGQAVEEFIRAEEPRAKAGEGQRAQLSPKYAYNRAIMLRRFAGTFANTAVCDLSKTHLDAFIGSLGDFSAKSRNHHRAAVKQFLQWAVRKDYLPQTHRLVEADTMRPERANNGEVQFYSPREFQALLEVADAPVREMIALSGLAGLRTAEVLRLDWADVWRVPGHIEITAGKAKTRQRRLVEICSALAAWLEPFRTSTRGKLWQKTENVFVSEIRRLHAKANVERKINALRHGFCSYHFALYGNENLTAAQAGNSPAMIHAHYKGLATKAEAEKWFAVAPTGAAQNVIPLPAATAP